MEVYYSADVIEGNFSVKVLELAVVIGVDPVYLATPLFLEQSL